MTQLEKFQIKCKNDIDFQNAIQNYAKKHNLILPEKRYYEFGIDYFDVWVDGKQVLVVSLPPVSNYKVRETEHTRKLLKSSLETANAELAIAV